MIAEVEALVVKGFLSQMNWQIRFRCRCFCSFCCCFCSTAMYLLRCKRGALHVPVSVNAKVHTAEEAAVPLRVLVSLLLLPSHTLMIFVVILYVARLIGGGCSPLTSRLRFLPTLPSRVLRLS